jgi:Mg-chelatase subunit ChlD
MSETPANPSAEIGDEELRRWRLILGGGENEGTGRPLKGVDNDMDMALEALYNGSNKGGLGDSAPNVARWLGDIRRYFPNRVVQMMQHDAIDRLNLRQLLLEPEMLEAVQPDVHMVATLLSLNESMPTQTRETAKQVVRKVVEELERKLATPLRQAVTGALNRAERNHRPRYHEIDWARTILTNMKHYQPAFKTVIPEKRIGHGHRRSALRDLILCIDQSGSMATSVVYASIFGAVLASLPSLKTHLVVFDTSVVDLTANLTDPVDLLFGAQLGGGTDIHQALVYCQSLIRRPKDTIFVLISDLYEGGDADEMLRTANRIVGGGSQMISLLALNDDGAPSFDYAHAGAFASMGIPTFACTPDHFASLLAALINRQDVSQWAAMNDIVSVRG